MGKLSVVPISVPVDVGSNLLHDGRRSLLHLLRIGDVEQVRAEVHGLRQLQPSFKLVRSLADHHVLSDREKKTTQPPNSRENSKSLSHS